ncbi:MAG TPA: hypothetical protein PLG25_13750, partial [bacterium]|nr:hypothetical protein [bacterium]
TRNGTEAGIAGVTLTLTGIKLKSATFCMPAWSPGNYRIVDYGRWVDSVQAWDIKGKEISVSRLNNNEWFVKNARQLARITYRIHDIPEDSVPVLPTTLNSMDRSTFFYNGPSVFGYIKGYQTEACQVEFQLPCGWRVWTPLSRISDFRYAARSYDELVDAPALLGTWPIEAFRFTLDSTDYHFVINSETDIKTDTLLNLAKTIIRYQNRLFDDRPSEAYYFLYNFFAAGSRYGALESTRASSYYLPPFASQRNLRSSYLIRVLAHEFFHRWNPERFHPKELHIINYQAPLRIQNLWFIEGVTEYYAQLTLVRTGLLSKKVFYNTFRDIAAENPSANLEALSRNASEIGVAPAMYTQGSLTAWLMDIEMRDRTDNAVSMDSLMVRMHRAFGKKDKPYDDKTLITTIKQFTGVDFTSFYSQYIAGGKPLPVREILEKAGLAYDIIYTPAHGWFWDVSAGGKLVVQSVSENSTAFSLGMQSGDIVTSIQEQTLPTTMDGIRTRIEALESLSVGESVRLMVQRNGKPIALKGTIVASQKPTVSIKEIAAPTEKQLRIRQSILSSP